MIKRILSLIIISGCVLFAHSIVQAQSPPLFGPNQYIRSTASPNFYDETFRACNTGATYNMVILNGNNGEDAISSATITLNGTEIVRGNEFNQRVERIEKTVTLNPENTLTVNVASGPGGFLTVSIECVSGCLEAQITSPYNQSTVNKSETIIKGNINNAYGETGVTITSGSPDGGVSSLAQVQGNGFAGLAPLQIGTNTITTTAVDACGFKALDTITVNTSSMEERIRLTVIPSSGVPSVATGIFEVSFEANVYIENSVSNYSWDFDGDGTPDQEGIDLSNVTHDYINPGLYFAKITVTDTEGNTYTETTIANVLTMEEMDTILQAKWEGMKEKLVVYDVDGTLDYFSEGSKEKYGEIFNLLISELPSLAANMQEMQFLYNKGNTAKYRIRRDQIIDGQQETVTYYIYFMKDENGLWKIVSF